VVECLSSKCEALNSNTSTAKERKGEKEGGRKEGRKGGREGGREEERKEGGKEERNCKLTYI
jgi:hypothetical protein